MAFAMEFLASTIPPSITIDNYDWASHLDPHHRHRKGFACHALAQANPSFRFIVQDLPGTIAAGKAQSPPDLLESGRIQYAEDDFFKPQPPLDADVFFLRAVLHDWPDKYCIKVLQVLIPGLKRGARVVTQDPHTPDAGEVGWWQDCLARADNLRMKCMFISRDRQKGEWERLFKRADESFRINGIRTHDMQPGNTAGQLMAVVEATWEG